MTLTASAARRARYCEDRHLADLLFSAGRKVFMVTGLAIFAHPDHGRWPLR